MGVDIDFKRFGKDRGILFLVASQPIISTDNLDYQANAQHGGYRFSKYTIKLKI